MAFATEIRKTVTDTTPVYAVVGATDLAVEKVRDARVKAAAARADFDVTALPSEAAKRVNMVAEQVQHVPTLALNRTLEIAGKAQESYGELAVRGENLVKRLRSQKSTQDLIDQASNTVALGKGAVTTARKAAIDTQRAAKATLTTGRNEVEKVVGTITASVHDEAETVAASVQDEAKTVAESVRESAASTRTAAKRTATTATNRLASATAAAKAATTSAQKSAASAGEATKTAAAKVGD